MTTSYSVEISPSNRAECLMCQKKIPKNVPRLKRNEYYGNRKYVRVLCHKCGLLIIKLRIEEIKEEKKLMKKLIRQKAKYIILGEIER